VKIAPWCQRIIRAHFTGMLPVDGIGVALAACGGLNPPLAALIHVPSELACLLNAARPLPTASPVTGEEAVKP
jgi:cation transport ATPase